MEARECPCSGHTLGKLLQPGVLAVLADGPLHGYRVARQVAGLAVLRDQPPDPRGVYRMLREMERGGLLVSTWDLSDAGPARRRYELTAPGRSCLRQWVCTLRKYRSAIDELLIETSRAARSRAAASTAEERRPPGGNR
jgi:DNA-binding PadR family transcriptional regulator